MAEQEAGCGPGQGGSGGDTDVRGPGPTLLLTSYGTDLPAGLSVLSGPTDA